MRKCQIKPIKCISCGKKMKPVKDTIKKTYTGYLWRCSCMPKGMIEARG